MSSNSRVIHPRSVAEPDAPREVQGDLTLLTSKPPDVAGWNAMKRGTAERKRIGPARLHDLVLEAVDFSGMAFDHTVEEYHPCNDGGPLEEVEVCDFRGCRLDRVDFSGCELAATSFRDTQLSGVAFVGASFGHVRENDRVLTSTFAGAAIRDTSFARGDLRRSDFSSARLTRCTLERADLRGARFCGAVLDEVDLSHADVRDVDLEGCSLRDVRLHATKVSASDAEMLGILEEAVPTLVYYTPPKYSQPALAFESDDPALADLVERFYRQAARDAPTLAFESERELDSYARDQRVGARRPSVFLSHTHKDKGFVRKLGNDLRRHGVRVWIDEAEIRLGDSLIERIRDGIDAMDYLAVVLTPASVQSEWVKREVDVAMNHEVEGKRVVVLPIVLEQCMLPGFLKGKLYADFTSPSRYAKGMQLLLDRLLG